MQHQTHFGGIARPEPGWAAIAGGTIGWILFALIGAIWLFSLATGLGLNG